MYTSKRYHYFSHKTELELFKNHYTYYFCIMSASPKQPNAPEGLYTNTVKQGEIACIALPNVAW